MLVRKSHVHGSKMVQTRQRRKVMRFCQAAVVPTPGSSVSPCHRLILLGNSMPFHLTVFFYWNSSRKSYFFSPYGDCYGSTVRNAMRSWPQAAYDSCAARALSMALRCFVLSTAHSLDVLLQHARHLEHAQPGRQRERVRTGLAMP